MDGYAFRFPEAIQSDLKLRVVAEAYAGQSLKRFSQDDGAVRIFTGADLPPDVNTVVPQEDVFVQADGCFVQFSLSSLQPHAHVRQAGEDLKQGATVMTRGQRMGPRHLALMAAIGCAEVNVLRRPRVALLSTGSELVEAGHSIQAHQTHDANRPMIAALCQELSIDVIDLGIVGDRPDTLRKTLRDVASECDMVISSGGVSVGEADHMRSVVEGLGQIDFWRLAIKPGKPLAMGQLRRQSDGNPAGTSANLDPTKATTPLIALPGNPVAALVTFEALVRPSLRHLSGEIHNSAFRKMLRARLTHPTHKVVGRTEYLRATLQQSAEGDWQATIMASQGAANLASLGKADGLVVLSHHCGPLQAMDWVDVLVFSE
jgi:molybdopterin molybdotransferase